MQKLPHMKFLFHRFFHHIYELIIVEKLKADVSTQAKKNESLTMQVNELTSFDYVDGIVKNMGLAYNNDNIIIIDE